MKGGSILKKKLKKPGMKNVCSINQVFAFDEGISDKGISGFNF